MVNDVKQKLKRVRALISEQRIDGILFTSQKNFSWLTCGRGNVNIATENAVAYILVTKSSTVLIVNNVEVNRILEEEVKFQFDQIEVFPWYDFPSFNSILSKLSSTDNIQTDVTLENEVAALRSVLTDEEVKRLYITGEDTAIAIERTAFEIMRGESEFEIAANLAKQCIKREIEPIVCLVAVDERIYTRKHPLPTAKCLDQYAMLVVCGRRNGLIVSATRLIHFNQPSKDLLRRHHSVLEIDSALIMNTVPGKTYGDLFQVMKNTYQNVGFVNEWKNHHQGGLSGYQTRERLLLPHDTSHKVLQNQIYAWNPSVPGAKSEDTIITENQGPKIVSITGDFPVVNILFEERDILRPDILIRQTSY